MKKEAMKNIMGKVNWKAVLSAVITVAGAITTVNDFASGMRASKEAEAQKEKLANLEKAVSDLQKKN